ncbi:enoyl-CoA hydratase/isomerase family protein [Alloiococcus otitis]|uniref:enoyl-CoA hydratase/isomerase family protein n=1 Tax=Alloiococcus otitis TaxID=1652 RepID=UPI002354453D|nr:enoyl-CoA hydratase/isomerase family protein [Alloiococcus otitis]
MTKEFPTIDYHVEDKIAYITLNRPEVGNAFASTTYGEIREAMALADQDDQVDVVIISGKGKHFCAGGDIQEFNKMLENNQVMEEEDILETGRLAKSLLTAKKPVIAALTGQRLELALAWPWLVTLLLWTKKLASTVPLSTWPYQVILA